MIDHRISEKHIIEAIRQVDAQAVPKNRQSTKFQIQYNGKLYPPKYIISIAHKIATGAEVKPSSFGGGKETNNFLKKLGFTIVQCNFQAITKNIDNHSVSSLSSDKTINTNESSSLSICSVVFHFNSHFYIWDNISYSHKMILLTEIIKKLPENMDILILPAGFTNSANTYADQMINKFSVEVSALLKTHNTNLVVYAGIDGRSKAEQYAITINKSGTVALARKFHHMDNSVALATSPFSKENGFSRTFSLKGKTIYTAVCYDLFGINQQKVENQENVDIVIGSIHGFDKSGSAVDFARKGLAGVAKQWNVPVFASSVFSNKLNPQNWPSGVEWKHGKASVKGMKYKDIELPCDKLHLEVDDIRIELRVHQA